MKKPKEHKRINDGILGGLERPALKWLAIHSPKWINSDIYTIIGVAGAAIAFGGYFLSRYNVAYLWLATFGFVVNWLGDSMDGTLARYRHAERPLYGYFVDHIVDAMTEVMFFLGIGITLYVTFDVAALALIAFLLMSVLVFVQTYVTDEFKISYAMLAPTEGRALAVILNTAMFFFREQVWQVKLSFLGTIAINPYDVYVGIIGLLLLYFFLTNFFKVASRLAKNQE